jgi:hypothetical protein
MINPELFNFTVVTENKFKRQNGEAVMAGFLMSPPLHIQELQTVLSVRRIVCVDHFTPGFTWGY